MYLDKNRSQL